MELWGARSCDVQHALNEALQLNHKRQRLVQRRLHCCQGSRVCSAICTRLEQLTVKSRVRSHDLKEI